ncbi:MAG: 30S ribosomal protein S6 [Elusimicrobia bacterium]|nr:30S ribosomal protein S6 [Elusimicrobiota bacterium]
MQIYETVVVIKPQLSDPEVLEVIDKTKTIISGEGGEILNEDKWGRRKLTYPIKHAKEGFYAYLKFKCPPAVLPKLSHHFRVVDSFLRTMTVQANERKMKPAKVKK